MPAKRGPMATRRSSVAIAFTPEGARKRVTIEDPAAVKVLYDPFRFAIVTQLDRPLAVKEIAERLGEPISKLYYHLKALERHGLIRVAEERMAGSNVERLYGRTAEEFAFSGRLGPPPASHFQGSLRSVMERISEGLKWAQSHEVAGGIRQAMDYREIRLSATKVEEFAAKLTDLVNSLSEEDERSQAYGFLFVMSPVKPERGRSTGKRKPHVRVVRQARRKE